MGFRTFVLKKAQAKARIWPWLVYLFQVRSAAARVKHAGATLVADRREYLVYFSCGAIE